MKRQIKRRVKKIFLFFSDYLLYNLGGIARVILSQKDANYYSLRKLKNLHKGERCFIIATGPSLRIQDVEKLKDEITFSVNSIFMIFDKTKWRSTYYLCLDERHLDKMLEQNGKLMNEVCTDYKFFNLNSKKSVSKSEAKIDKALFLPISRINQLNYPLGFNTDHFYFREDPVRGIYNSGTVTNSAIIMAMYMGFKTIYLLGTDCNYQTQMRHVGKDWNDDIWSVNDLELIERRMRNGFEEIAKVANKRGVKIYNATRGGMLESFERVDFDTLYFSGGGK